MLNSRINPKNIQNAIRHNYSAEDADLDDKIREEEERVKKENERSKKNIWYSEEETKIK